MDRLRGSSVVVTLLVTRVLAPHSNSRILINLNYASWFVAAVSCGFQLSSYIAPHERIAWEEFAFLVFLLYNIHHHETCSEITLNCSWFEMKNEKFLLLLLRYHRRRADRHSMLIKQIVTRLLLLSICMYTYVICKLRTKIFINRPLTSLLGEPNVVGWLKIGLSNWF